jgi:transcriptional regulator with XRE-family HTH domain
MSNMKKNSGIAEKLKKARKAVGLSQKQLGKVLKLSDKAISSYEVGRATPPIETLREISKVTYKPVSYFLDEETKISTVESRLQIIERELAEIRKELRASEKK